MDIFRQHHGTGGRTCSTGQTIQQLEDSQREAMLAALDDKTIQTTAIAKVLESWTGRRWSASTVAYHRRGGCLCG